MLDYFILNVFAFAVLWVRSLGLQAYYVLVGNVGFCLDADMLHFVGIRLGLSVLRSVGSSVI